MNDCCFVRCIRCPWMSFDSLFCHYNEVAGGWKAGRSERLSVRSAKPILRRKIPLQGQLLKVEANHNTFLNINCISFLFKENWTYQEVENCFGRGNDQSELCRLKQNRAGGRVAFARLIARICSNKSPTKKLLLEQLKYWSFLPFCIL